MVEIKFNKVFQFKSYNQAPSIFNECRDLFKKDRGEITAKSLRLQ